MKNNKLKLKLSHYRKKLEELENLFGKKELNVSYDVLNKEKKTNYELLYFDCGSNEKIERKGVFVFGYDFYLKELKDQELKRTLGENPLNFQIHEAYLSVKKKIKSNSVGVNDIIVKVMANDNGEVDMLYKNKILQRIMTLAYYHNWDLKKEKGSIDAKYLVVIPDTFRKVKKRFNLKSLIFIKEDDENLFYVNSKGDLIAVMKDKNEFSKKDIEKRVFKFMKDNFNIKKIVV